MKFALALSLLAILGCATTPVTSEYMIISPKSVTIAKYDSVSSVSITHSCTCPFGWSSKIIPADPADTLAWLTFPQDTVGDHQNIPIAVHPWEMPHDTNTAKIAINSDHGTYGSDTIVVVAYR